MKESGVSTRVSANRGWWAAGTLMALALVVRVVHLDHTPVYDEFYHILAAQSWIEHHTFAISEGVYTRAATFTVLVAEFFRLFGESLIVARLPALIAGTLLVPLVFLWTRSVAGPCAAWATALLTTFSPLLIFLSQTVRFYTLQTLCVFLAAISVYALIMQRVRGRTALAVASAAVAAMALSIELQLTSGIVAAALLVWASGVGLRPLMRLAAGNRRLMVGAATVLVLGLGIAGWFWRAELAALWRTFRVPPYWEMGMAENHRYYFYWFMDNYPTLWSLFPLAAIFAVARRPGPGVFGASVFIVAIVISSIAGPKQDRYIVSVLPFFFLIWGIAIAELKPFIYHVASLASGAIFGDTIRPGTRQLLARAAVLLSVLFVIASNPAFPLSYRMLTRSDADWTGSSGYRGHANWALAVPKIMAAMKHGDIILTNSGVKALYYLGHYDFEINASNLHETRSKKEFSVDPRTGKRVVGDVAAVKLIMQCYPRGLVIAETRTWEHSPRIVPTNIAAYVSAHSRSIQMPVGSRLQVFEWQRRTSEPSARCDELR